MVTGGSRGLGRAMAQALAEVGADVILVGRDLSALQKARFEIGITGHTIDIVTGDMSIPEEAERVCKEALRDYGPVDILVNNVGGRRLDLPLEDMSLAQWQHLIDLNLSSAFIACQRIGNHMAGRGRGTILNVASIAAFRVIEGIGGRTYEIAKAGMENLTKCLAADWAKKNVRVNCVAPGPFLTDPNKKWFEQKPEFREKFESKTPMGRLGDPKEIGPLAVYLCSDASSFVTGSTFVIDGGYTLW